MDVGIDGSLGAMKIAENIHWLSTKSMFLATKINAIANDGTSNEDLTFS